MKPFIILSCVTVLIFSSCKQADPKPEPEPAQPEPTQPITSTPQPVITNDYLSSANSETSLKDSIAHEVAEYSRDGAMIGAVTLVAKDGEILDLQAHGIKNLETNEPVEPDSIFKIHPFTKSITCAAALMLYEQGKFSFDDPVSKWLPEFKTLTIEPEEKDGQQTAASAPMLVKHLFTHTSGLTYKDSDNVFKAGDLEAVVKVIASNPLAFEPGTDWSYGMSIDVIGRLIEVWSGQKYQAFIQENLLSPLGMKDTAFYVPADQLSRKVTIYKSSDENATDFIPDEKYLETPTSQPDFCMPGGGLYSTAADYYKFLNMIISGGTSNGRQYLKAETIKLMTTNQVPDSIGWVKFGKETRDGFGYGYGFNVVTQASNFDPAAQVGECGWGGKASCHYWFNPESKIAVITLEQIIPYRPSLETVLKGYIYDKQL